MSDTKFPPEIAEDEFADDDIITLYSPEGEAIDFVEIAGIAHQGSFYVILQPVDLPEGMADDEALVFEVTDAENGESNYSFVSDEEIIDAVFKNYNELLDKVENDNKKK